MNFLSLLMVGIVVTTGTTRSVSKLEWTTKRPASTGQDKAVSTYAGGNYCGPGWGFTYKDLLDGRIRQLPAAIDAIDEACRMHDTCYEDNGYLTQGCNLVLTYDLVKVVVDDRSTAQQRLDAATMAAVFFIESQSIDLGVLAMREATEVYQRIVGQVVGQAASFEAAIKREMALRGAGRLP